MKNCKDSIEKQISRISEWLKNNKVRAYIISSTFIILLVCLFVDCKFIGFNPISISITVLLVVILIIECFWKLIKENIGIFLRKSNILKTILLFVFIGMAFLIACCIAYFFGSFVDSQNNGGNQSNILPIIPISGLLLAIMGIFVSARVLMAINKSQTTKISEWLELTTDIVRDASRDATVYIVAPTYCPGLSTQETKHLLDQLYTLMERKKDRGVKFNCAFLKTNFEDTPNFETMKESMNKNTNYMDVIINDFHWDMFKMFRADDYNKKQKCEDKIDFVRDTYVQLKEYYERMKKITETGKLESLKGSYLETAGHSSFSGFFISAKIRETSDNDSLGRYYFGTFVHDGYTSFNGTEFRNNHIGTEMKNFIEDYVSRKVL